MRLSQIITIADDAWQDTRVTNARNKQINFGQSVN